MLDIPGNIDYSPHGLAIKNIAESFRLFIQAFKTHGNNYLTEKLYNSAFLEPEGEMRSGLMMYFFDMGQWICMVIESKTYLGIICC